MKTLEERFWSKVYKTDTCWLWIGHRLKAGYGVISVGGKNYLAHRLSYELNIGQIPEGKYICHKCDNPPCVNPEHFFVGDATANMQDASSKGRMHVWEDRTIEQKTEIAHKISAAQKGKSFTPEHLENLRQAHAARRGTERSVPWNKGIPMTEEVKQKISEGRIGKGGRALTAEAEVLRVSRISNSRKGMKFSEEHRKNLSEAVRNRVGKKSNVN